MRYNDDRKLLDIVQSLSLIGIRANNVWLMICMDISSKSAILVMVFLA
jgi:hypothetical protein